MGFEAHVRVWSVDRVFFCLAVFFSLHGQVQSDRASPARIADARRQTAETARHGRRHSTHPAALAALRLDAFAGQRWRHRRPGPAGRHWRPPLKR